MSLLLPRASGNVYAHARVEFLIQEIMMTRALLLLEAEVRSSSVCVVYVLLLRIVFSKAALQERGSMEPVEPPLNPPLYPSLGGCHFTYPVSQNIFNNILLY